MFLDLHFSLIAFFIFIICIDNQSVQLTVMNFLTGKLGNRVSGKLRSYGKVFLNILEFSKLLVQW